VASAFLIGCGSSDDSSSTNNNTTTTQTAAIKEGIFIDAPVSGLSYTTTSGLSGATDEAGHFKYKAGDSVTFKLGNVELGSGIASNIISPKEISNNDVNKSARIAYILQNLDTDGILELKNLSHETIKKNLN
jgi:hypothetical protein